MKEKRFWAMTLIALMGTQAVCSVLEQEYRTTVSEVQNAELGNEAEQTSVKLSILDENNDSDLDEAESSHWNSEISSMDYPGIWMNSENQLGKSVLPRP